VMSLSQVNFDRAIDIDDDTYLVRVVATCLIDCGPRMLR